MSVLPGETTFNIELHTLDKAGSTRLTKQGMLFSRASINPMEEAWNVADTINHSRVHDASDGASLSMPMMQ